MTEATTREIKAYVGTHLKEKKMSIQTRERLLRDTATISDLLWAYEEPMCPKARKDREITDIDNYSLGVVYKRLSDLHGVGYLEYTQAGDKAQTLRIDISFFKAMKEAVSREIAYKARQGRKLVMATDFNQSDLIDLLAAVFDESN